MPIASGCDSGNIFLLCLEIVNFTDIDHFSCDETAHNTNEVVFSYGWSKYDPISPGASFSSLIIFTREASHSIKKFRYQRKEILKLALVYESSLN